MALETKLTMKKVYAYSSDDFIEKEVVVEKCYVKIEKVSGDKEALMLNVGYYDQTRLLKTARFAFTPSVADGSENFIRQGYEYLKTLPEFARAVDC
jgi:hypothetical protein